MDDAARISITVEATRQESELDVLREGMRRYTEQHVVWSTYEDLTTVLRDETGRFLGAALGEAGRGWLHVSVMWIHEDYRGQGYGRQLLEFTEAEAFRRGCRMSYLDTFSYQARPFYERCGYRVFGTLNDYPAGHSRYFMCKHLRVEPARRVTDADPGPRILVPIQIRKAELSDIEAITEIYNEAILTTTATFDTEPKSVEEQRAWFDSHDDRHPIIVADDGRVVGWACISRWSDRPAYDATAETSFYVKGEHRGKGVGRRLKAAVIEEARRLGFHTLLARVADGSEASLHLNEAFGFQHVGTMKEVGRKFERLIDVHMLQLILDSPS